MEYKKGRPYRLAFLYYMEAMPQNHYIFLMWDGCYASQPD